MTFCDQCRFSTFDFSKDALLVCSKRRLVRFFGPFRSDSKHDFRESYIGPKRTWGWHYIKHPRKLKPSHCPDFKAQVTAP